MEFASSVLVPTVRDAVDEILQSTATGVAVDDLNFMLLSRIKTAVPAESDAVNDRATVNPKSPMVTKLNVVQMFENTTRRIRIGSGPRFLNENTVVLAVSPATTPVDAAIDCHPVVSGGLSAVRKALNVVSTPAYTVASPSSIRAIVSLPD